MSQAAHRDLAKPPPSIDDFRATVRDFFGTRLADALASNSASDSADGGESGSDSSNVGRAKAWRRALFDHGLAGLDYPVAYGGRGLEDDYLSVYRDESRGHIPREEAVFGIGVGMALPTIRDHGTDEQRERFLRPGLRGEEIWCQMYSEPGAGSDLASLSTSAFLDGDEWVITGQKVWTSGAHQADLAVALVRTDPDAPKHRGITMLVIPMDQPGVEVRPLVQMTGASEFNEVFLDEARAPRSWVIGEVNGGWAMGVALLAHERRNTGVASMAGNAEQHSKAGRSPIPVAQLRALATDKGRLADPVVRQALAELHTGERLVAWLGHRAVSPSIGKLWRTSQGRAAADLAAKLAFPTSPAWRTEADAAANGDRPTDLDDYFAYHVLNCRGMSLGGGTDEIQRNTLAERELGLPREPGPDRNTPFKDLPRN